jgi:hypothetical protein
MTGYNIFTRNMFLAAYPESGFAYPAIRIVNPYTDGELLLGEVDKHVDNFFVNPAAKLSFIDENAGNVYTFIDENTVVKYYQNDVLDYANYRSGTSNGDTMRDYEAAMEFISTDPYVTNEFYLSGYDASNGETTFYFDYVINNLPLMLPDEYKREGAATLRAAIEVTVREESVVHYRKLVYNFQTDSTEKSAHLDFDAALAAVSGSWNVSANGLLSDVLLGYKIDRNKQAYLYWVMQTGGGTLSQAG